MLSGPSLSRKGWPGHYEIDITIDVGMQRVIFHKFGNLRGFWTPSRTEVGFLGSKDPLTVRENPRAAFQDRERITRWDEHQLFYFFGYALRYYFTLPFCLRLPGFKTWEMEPMKVSNDQTWRVLKVEFPEDFITHTKIQQLYFDQEFRLRRMG